MSIRVLCLAGSTRSDSLNKRLIRAAAVALEDSGAHATVLDLRDYALPLYDGDLEAASGIPAPALALKTLFKAHGALVIASPEYNASMSAVLKNALDWVSRPHGDEAGSLPYRGKVAALLAASPGALGGLRGLTHLRVVLQALGVLVLPEQLAVARAHDVLSAEDRLNDASLSAQLSGLMARLVEVGTRLA